MGPQTLKEIYKELKEKSEIMKPALAGVQWKFHNPANEVGWKSFRNHYVHNDVKGKDVNYNIKQAYKRWKRHRHLRTSLNQEVHVDCGMRSGKPLVLIIRFDKATYREKDSSNELPISRWAEFVCNTPG